MKQAIRMSALCFLASLPLPSFSAAILDQVTIDTTPLAGVSGFLAFDLLGGSPFQGNVATISMFATTGTLGATSPSGDVTGTLAAPPVVLTASTFFNEYLQAIAFGSGLTTFELSLTSNFMAGSTPDTFSFFLLDSTMAPFATSDPGGSNALFIIDLSDSPVPQVFTSASASATVVPASTALPEPRSSVLLLLGCVVLGARRVARR